MLDEGLPPSDGVTIARSVRDLARRAHRVLDDPSDEDEARGVFAAIEGLERQIEPGSSRELGRWLVSLRRRVESRLPTAV